MHKAVVTEQAILDRALKKLNSEERTLIIALIERDPLAPVYGMATVGYILVLCSVLLWPFDIGIKAQTRIFFDLPYGLWAFHPAFLRDIISNIVYFIPYGFVLTGLLRHTKQKGWWMLVIGSGLLLSGSVELLQHWSPSRHSSFADVATNFTGTAIGLAAHRFYNLLLKKL
ncbi:MAG: VanZ family protein [Desulfobacteraceae bacterium]|nr:VanZ family protein [Desulfobacteraceae bacterium]